LKELMSNLLFLGFAAVFTAVGCTVIWLRQRKPTGVDTGIDAFKRELEALAPDRENARPREVRRDPSVDRPEDGRAG
jgi:hypothetical protein